MCDYFYGDFYVHTVEFDEHTGTITGFVISESIGVDLCEPFYATREETIQAVEDGYVVMMMGDCSFDKAKGHRLFVVEVEGQKYLREDDKLISDDAITLAY
jgi:hypothetical protein